MSSEEVTADMCCACCGKAEVDDIKLKGCGGGCDLVKYCSDECQQNHSEQHEEECKKRKNKLRDKKLFTQPDAIHLDECPICCLPLPIGREKYTMSGCCSNYICNGCSHTNKKREIEAGLEQRCVFCREPVSKTNEEHHKRVMKRVKKNNCPVAMTHIGMKCDEEGDHETALEYLTKAAGLGDAEAHYVLSIMYLAGRGVEKDKRQKVYHLEEAAIRGHPYARHNLGCEEWRNDKFERARKHFIIAANLGCNESLNGLRQLYADGHASKEDYADALRAYQAAVDATKSSERERAEEAKKNGEMKPAYDD